MRTSPRKKRRLSNLLLVSLEVHQKMTQFSKSLIVTISVDLADRILKISSQLPRKSVLIKWLTYSRTMICHNKL